jgi:hypothetical protein
MRTKNFSPARTSHLRLTCATSHEMLVPSLEIWSAMAAPEALAGCGSPRNAK